jgi:hypothetical protein
VREILNDGWDLLIVAHPPCTQLCNSGVRWLHKPSAGKTLEQMWNDLREGAELFSDVWNTLIPYIGVENPVMHSRAKEFNTELCRVFSKRATLAVRPIWVLQYGNAIMTSESVI